MKNNFLNEKNYKKEYEEIYEADFKFFFETINFVQPVIPPVLKVMGASGEVKVQVIIDENGNVISARAITGKLQLWLEAQKAAQALKFSPTLLSGKPVKVKGIIVYNFAPR